MTLQNNTELNKILQAVNKEGFPVEGFTKYQGNSQADMLYPKMFNTLLGMMLELHRKLNDVLESLTLQQKETEVSRDYLKELEGIEKQLEKLTITPLTEKPKVVKPRISNLFGFNDKLFKQ